MSLGCSGSFRSCRAGARPEPLPAPVVNGEVGKGNVDLYLRAGAPAIPAAFDCAGERTTPFEFCRVASPAPGTWHALVAHRTGTPRFQITTTLFAEEPPEPPPPPGEWLTSPGLPGFRGKARITPPGQEPIEGRASDDCIAEALCLEGALAGRPEAFLKVIGPRPNGFLWVQISRFTPSEIELWVAHLATGELRYYRLPTVGWRLWASSTCRGERLRSLVSSGYMPSLFRS